jgi:hypothetical protein
MLDPTKAVSLAKQLLPQWSAEKERLDVIDQWYRGDTETLIRAPRGATQELKALLKLAQTPYLRLVVGTVAQALYVDGYRSPSSADNSGPWDTWQRNDQDSRQVATHRAAVKYGYSFETVLPGVVPGGEASSVIKAVSPRRLYAVWQSPESDDWPMYALQVESSGGGLLLQLIDEDAVHMLSATSADGGEITYLEHRIHGSGVTPVVRFSGDLDEEGRSFGEVAPFIPVASRINKTAYDRMMVQHFNSWKVRTIAGMSKPDGAQYTEEDEKEKKIQLRQDDILIADDPDTRFGTLDETPLDGFINAYDSDVESLAVVSQTPTYALTGNLVNLAADALSEARSGLIQKIHQYKVAFGASHDRKLRLAAHQQGDTAAAEDFASHVTWQDTEIRSLSQAADALGKIADQLGVPVQALWPRIPGVTKLDVDEWERMARQGGAIQQLQSYLERQGGAQDAGAVGA